MKKTFRNILIVLMMTLSVFVVDIKKTKAQTFDCFVEIDGKTVEHPGNINNGGAKPKNEKECNDAGGSWAEKNLKPQNTSPVKDLASGLTNFALGAAGASIGYVVFQIIAWVYGLSAILLDGVLDFTVVKLKDNISGLTGINIVWDLIRNLVNLSFIFILLYEGFKSIIGKGSPLKTIASIIQTALLINFSLFFTRVIIDASNILTLFFYNSITNNGADSISKTIESALKLSTFWENTPGMSELFAGGATILITYIMGSFFMLIATIVLFAISMLFVIRYVSFIVLLAISPIGVAGWLPGLKDYSAKYWTVLKNQAIWPPVYMVSTWIILTLISSEGFIVGQTGNQKFTDLIRNPIGTSNIGLIINYVVVISLLIFSFTSAKKTATGASDYLSTGFDKLTAFSGGAIAGAGGWAFRNSLGRAGNSIINSEKLKEKADNGGRVSSWASKQLLKIGDKASTSQFDYRNTTAFKKANSYVNTNVGKPGDFLWKKGVGEGGYVGVKEKAIKEGNIFVEGTKDSEKFAEKLSYSPEKIKEAKEYLKNIKNKQKEVLDRDNWLKTSEDEDAKQYRKLEEEIDTKYNSPEVLAAGKEHNRKTIEVKVLTDKLNSQYKERKAIISRNESTDTIDGLIYDTKKAIEIAKNAEAEAKKKYDESKSEIEEMKAKRDSIKSRWMSEDWKKQIAIIGGQEESKDDFGNVTKIGIKGRGGQYLSKKADSTKGYIAKILENDDSPVGPKGKGLLAGLFTKKTEKEKALRELAKKIKTK